MNWFNILISEYSERYHRNKWILIRSLLCYYRDPDFRVVTLIRYATNGNVEYLRKKCVKKLLVKYGVAISRKCKIGKSFHPAHYLGLVIGPGVVIGDNCVTYQQVTLGQKDGLYPVLGNNVTVYTGAKIIGNVHIGNNVCIGANAVVLQDIPDNSTAVGVPARIIKKG